MPSLGTANHTNDYLLILKNLGPLAAFAGALTFTVGLHCVRKSYLQRTPVAVFSNLLFSALMSAILVICVLCMSEWILPPLSPKLELGIAVAIGVFGVKGIDVFFRRKFKLSIVDLMDPQDINDIRLNMPEEDRKKHLAQCPFKADESCDEQKESCSNCIGHQRGKRNAME